MQNNLVHITDLNLSTESIEMRQFEIDNITRPDYDNRFRKLIFFLCHEGVSRTLRKIKSKKYDKLSNKLFATYILIQKDNKNYINISLQYHNHIDYFVIENKFYRFESEFDKISFSENKEDFNQFVKLNYNSLKINMDNMIFFDKKEDASNKKYDNGVFVFGLGDYSRVYIGPHLVNHRKICCVDYNSQLAFLYKKLFNFESCGLTIDKCFDSIRNTTYPIVVIATYHSDHARIAAEVYGLNNNSLIFIEKPPVVTLEDLHLIIDLYKKGANIEIGFNRRHIPFNKQVKTKLINKKAIITISIKEVLINQNHWYNWKNQGTRITGNLVHWIDLSIYWIDSLPIEINMLTDDTDTLVMSILFENGSIVNISVGDEGNSLRGVQEFIEIRYDNETIKINDYLDFVWLDINGKKKKSSRLTRNKGHDLMYQELFKNNINNKRSYRVDDLIKTSVLTHQAKDMFLNKVRNVKVKNKILNLIKLTECAS